MHVPAKRTLRELDAVLRCRILDMTSMFYNAIFGPNTTIVVGDNNFQRVDSSIIQGDFDSLRRQLTQLGIDEAVIEELHQIESREKSGSNPEQATSQPPATERRSGCFTWCIWRRRSLAAYVVSTSICRSFATVSSGLCRFLPISNPPPSHTSRRTTQVSTIDSDMQLK